MPVQTRLRSGRAGHTDASGSGDQIRALIAETYGAFDDLRNWENPARRAVPQLLLSDCRSLVVHLNSEIPAKISDKRLGIEMAAIRQQLWTDDVRRTWNEFPSGGDALCWISTSTITMVSDVLTKSMRADSLLKTLRQNTYSCETKVTSRIFSVLEPVAGNVTCRTG